MSSRIALFILGWALLGSPLVAESKERVWSAEVDLVQGWIPGVQIVMAKVGREVVDGSGQPGELWLGVYLRPGVTEHEVVDALDEYAASLTYRQYVWEALHVEATAFVGWAWAQRNLVDGKDYSTLSLLGEVSVGYRFDLYQAESWGVYLAPQAGVLQGLPPTSIGPRGGNPDTFVTAKLLAGVRF